MIREDEGRMLFSDGVFEEIKQLQNLIGVEPQLTLADIAHRMATTRPQLRRMMQLMNISHPERDIPLQADRQAGAATRRRNRRMAK